MKIDQEYVKKLEETISKLMAPLKGIPFPIAIKALSGCEVFTFDSGSKDGKRLIQKLSEAAQIGGEEAFSQGIFTARPNEAGNKIEPFVLKALNKVGLKARKPLTKSGRKRSAGYPDIQIEDEEGRTIYLDCKTYSAKTKDQSFRTFYFSPSDDPKITKDAFHLVMSFELDIENRKGKRTFVPTSWQIHTLDKLLVQVKHEFNASNRDLYRKDALLSEGKIRN